MSFQCAFAGQPILSPKSCAMDTCRHRKSRTTLLSSTDRAEQNRAGHGRASCPVLSRDVIDAIIHSVKSPCPGSSCGKFDTNSPKKLSFAHRLTVWPDQRCHDLFDLLDVLVHSSR